MASLLLTSTSSLLAGTSCPFTFRDESRGLQSTRSLTPLSYKAISLRRITLKAEVGPDGLSGASRQVSTRSSLDSSHEADLNVKQDEGQEVKELHMVPLAASSTLAISPWPLLSSFQSSSTTSAPLQLLGEKEAMGLVLCAAVGTGWTTFSGLEGPSASSLSTTNGSTEESLGTKPWPPLISKSPRRRMAVEFTCNKCGERTMRAINSHAYKEGTVFVQCKGCSVFHKLVDHLHLFHELKGPIFDGYGTQGFGYHEPYDPLGADSASRQGIEDFPPFF